MNSSVKLIRPDGSSSTYENINQEHLKGILFFHIYVAPETFSHDINSLQPNFDYLKNKPRDNDAVGWILTSELKILYFYYPKGNYSYIQGISTAIQFVYGSGKYLSFIKAIDIDGKYSDPSQWHPSSENKDEPLNKYINENLTFDLTEYDPNIGISSVRLMYKGGNLINKANEHDVYFKAPKITLSYIYIIYGVDGQNDEDVEEDVEYQAQNGLYFTTSELILHILNNLKQKQHHEDPHIHFEGLNPIRGEPGFYGVLFGS